MSSILGPNHTHMKDNEIVSSEAEVGKLNVSSVSEQCVSTKVNAVSLQSPCFYNCNVNFAIKKDTSSE